jgi:hypothetical protein
MSYKPSDFFVGIVDFFSIVLPGAVLLLFYWEIVRDHILALLPLDASSEVQLWLGFLLAAYVLGHFITALSSWSLDPLYDRTYRQAMWKKKGGQDLKNAAQAILERAPYYFPNDTLKWSTVLARSQSPSAALEIDRLDADSKFFRSFTIVLILILPRFIYQMAWVQFIVCLLFVPISFLRFCTLRWKRTQRTYEYFITMNRIENRGLIPDEGPK